MMYFEDDRRHKKPHIHVGGKLGTIPRNASPTLGVNFLAAAGHSTGLMPIQEFLGVDQRPRQILLGLFEGQSVGLKVPLGRVQLGLRWITR